MGLSRNKVAVSEGAAGSPPFYGESGVRNYTVFQTEKKTDGDSSMNPNAAVVQFSGTGK